MPVKRLLSWNVNGIRAVVKKGFVAWLKTTRADVICIQETKAQPEQMPEELQSLSGYTRFYSSAEKKGYSGVALFTRMEPKSVDHGFGIPEFDNEGRILIANFDSFVLYNIYFPNGKMSKQRLDYKMAFYDAFLAHADQLRHEHRSIVVCGDVNTAHQEIDLFHPKENAKTSGFLPIERSWIDTFISHGYIDTFRMFNKEPGQYTWWDYKSRARERNIGWRIDYFFISEDLQKSLVRAFILPEVQGSDHCPVGIDFRVT